MTTVADLVTPAWDYLLVRRDAHSRQIGVGLNGKALIAPEGSADLQTCRSGVVVKSGPSAPYKPGVRVIFGSYAMTVLEVEGNEGGKDSGALGLLPSTEVLCTIAASEDLIPRPLAVEGAGFARAPYGFMLARRSTVGSSRGKILLPGSYVDSIRSQEAEIVEVNSSIKEQYPAGLPFPVGTLVLLAPQAGRPITFGLQSEIILYSITPSQIRAVISQSTAGDIVDDESPLKFSPRPTPSLDDLDPRWDEGDPRAPR